jgi:hypothetical protein
MATTISNPASFSSVRTAFNAEGYGISTSFFAYRQGGGIVPATSGFNAIGAGTGGDPLQLSQFSGFTVPSPIQVNITDHYIYSGAGGFDFAEAVATYALSDAGNAYFTITGDTFLQENYAGEWLVSGNGALVSAKATVLSQSLGSGSILYGVYNTFQPLTSLRQWSLSSTAAQADSQDSALVTIRIDLALTSDTNTILDTAEIQLETRAETAQ